MDNVSLNAGEDGKPAEVVAECPVESVTPTVSTEQTSCEDASSFQKYFETDSIPLDAGGIHTYFDSLSVNSSPMMKSIADITAIQDSDMLLEKSPSENIASLEIESESKVTFSMGDELNEPVEMEEKHGNKQPVLSHLFSEERSGSDQQGKAFFDHISNTGPQTLSVSITGAIVPVVASPSSTSLFLLDTEESECYYSAWIPSSATQKALIAMVTASPGTYFPDKEHLTMPGVIFEENAIVDPVKLLLSELQMPLEERATLTANSVSQDENGLRELIKAKCYHAAINLTTRLLTACQQGPSCGGHPSRHTPYTLQLWYTRLALLIKLRKFSYAEIESEVFGDLDKPDIYYEFYSDSYGASKGSMAPFSFRILVAELPQYQGNYQKTLEKLYALLVVVEKILQNLGKGLAEDGSMMEISDNHRKASTLLWQKRERDIYYSVLNCVLAQRDFVMAVHMVHSLLEKDVSAKARLYLALGRIHLQLGDIKAANECFNYFSELSDGQNINIQVENLINKALMAIAQNGYPDAYKYYSEAYALQPSNPLLANNMAVTLLYMGKLKESLLILEKTVRSDPNRCLHEGILFNICVLYELESSASLEKKKDMLRLVAAHTGDNFQTTCLKIDSINRNIPGR